MSGRRSPTGASRSRTRGISTHRAAPPPQPAGSGEEAPLPAWALEVEEQLLKTARWQSLLARMADEVQDKLAHNGVAVRRCGLGGPGRSRPALNAAARGTARRSSSRTSATTNKPPLLTRSGSFAPNAAPWATGRGRDAGPPRGQAEHALERTPALAEFREEVADAVDKQLEAVTSQDLVHGRGTSRVRSRRPADALLPGSPPRFARARPAGRYYPQSRGICSGGAAPRPARRSAIRTGLVQRAGAKPSSAAHHWPR